MFDQAGLGFISTDQMTPHYDLTREESNKLLALEMPVGSPADNTTTRTTNTSNTTSRPGISWPESWSWVEEGKVSTSKYSYNL